jgi:fructosamine-3-kinase
MYNFNLSIILPINDDFELSFYEMYVKFIVIDLDVLKRRFLFQFIQLVVIFSCFDGCFNLLMKERRVCTLTKLYLPLNFVTCEILLVLVRD